MRELIQFWGARLDEDEQAAMAALGRHQPDDWTAPLEDPWPEDETHVRRHGPERVLADVAAKRKLLDAYAKATANQLRREDAGLHLAWTILGLAVRTLVEAHDEHRDYQEEWRP